jgi:hypothetical protein
MAQAISRRFPTAAARVPSHIGSYKSGGQSGDIEADFLRELQFPLPILIPPSALYSLIMQSSTLHSPDIGSVLK